MRGKPMNIFKRSQLFTVLFSFSLGSYAAPIEKSDLPEHVNLPAQTIMAHYIRANTDILKAAQIEVVLPNGKTINIGRKGFTSHPNGSQVWRGKAYGIDNSSILFASHGSALAGVMHIDGDVYKLQHVGNGIYVLAQVSPNEPLPEHDPIELDTFSSGGSSSAPATDQASDDGSQIDVMVAYSTNMKDRYGIDGANALIALAMAESNVAYSNSLINTQLRLVHTVEVENTSGDFSADLSNLRGQSDGHLDEIHALRDSYGADMVTWFMEGTQYCGIGYLNTGDLSQDDHLAFSVVASSCATGYYSTAHELGHNMGSTHDRANGGSAVYSYSYGYQDPSSAFRTVMAYNCPGGCIRKSYFSNPDVTIDGAPTGIDAAYSNSADNARSINQTRIPVSQWRTAVVGTPPSASFTVNCTLLDCSFINATSSDDPIDSWSWEFGDGSTSSVQHPNHTYILAGDYTVVLTATDSTGAIGMTTAFISVLDDTQEPPAPTNPPIVPGNFDVPATAENTVLISWTDSDTEDNYVLERQNKHPKNGKWVGSTTITLNQNTISYTDSPGSGLFRYQLKATNQYGSAVTPWLNVDVTSTSTGGGNKGGGKGKKK